MVEAGQLQLIGTLDTTDIERGQRKIQVGFDNVQAKTDSSVGSLSSLAGVSKGLLATFAGLGAVAGTSIIGIAANSPQAAASIARIKAQSQQLSFAIGEELAPAFEKAADLYAKFVDSASTEGSFVNTGITFFGSVLKGVLKDLDKGIEKTEKLLSINLLGSDENSSNQQASKVLRNLANKEPTIDDSGAVVIDAPKINTNKKTVTGKDFFEFTGSRIEERGFFKALSDPLNYFYWVDKFKEQNERNQINSSRNSTFNTTDTTGGNLE